jgi:hypothetical protein
MTIAPVSSTAKPTPTRLRAATGQPRDRFVDGLRAASLIVVVAWHWVFTVISWDHVPHSGNPIGSVPGLWALTWVLQVMPLFFWVGGFAHLRTWESVECTDTSRWRRCSVFYRRRLGRLLKPTALCLSFAVVLRVAGGVLFPQTAWLTSATLVLLSPLWFLGVYLALVLLAPVAIAAHRRFGETMPVVLCGAAGMVDILRFRYGIPYVAWLNLIIVWALAHQLGFFYQRLVSAGRRVAVAICAGGLFGLVGLTSMGLYPRSMVGVPGQTFSNMDPPTLCIVALCLLQIGIAMCVRPALVAWLEPPRIQHLTDWMSRRSMTVLLWHFVGFAFAYAALWQLGLHAPQAPNPTWWAERPLYVVTPALLTAPMIMAFGRFDRAGR